MTLGCGAAGGNITSDNISPLHLINLKRVAYGVRDVAAPPPIKQVAAAAAASTVGIRATIEQVVDQWLGRGPSLSGRGAIGEAQARQGVASKEGSGQGAPSCSPGAIASPKSAPAPVAPPLSSFKDLEPPKPPAPKKETKPAGFVCEEDVRAAIQANAKIVVGKKTIITPSARDLAESSDVFIVAET